MKESGMLLYLLLLMIGAIYGNESITVSPSLQVDCNTVINTPLSPNSTNLTTALKELKNNDVLYLEEGCHNLTSYELISNLTNITIQASSNTTTITCMYGIGLGFFNITDLTIQGITVDRCSLIGNENLGNAMLRINETLSLVYDVSDNTKVAILLADIHNLTLRDVTVQNNKGIGLLGINIMGQSNLESLMFSNNTPNECMIELDKYIDVPDANAGGMFLLYADYRAETNIVIPPSLNIDESTFQYNQQCSVFSSITISAPTSPSYSRIGFFIGGGGALGLVLSQLSYSVGITVSRTIFNDNQGIQGSVYIVQFQGSSGSQVLFNDCSFSRNGFGNFGGRNNFLRSTGGAIALNLDTPFNFRRIATRNNLIGNRYTFQNIDFIDNRAYLGAGISIFGLNAALTTIYNENEVHINNCTFKGNLASIGPALYAFEYKYSGLQPGVQLYINNVTVEDNNGNMEIIPGLEPTVMVVASMNMTLSGECIFRNNTGSSLLLLTSSVHTYDNILFEDNLSTSGGAILIFSDSYFIIHNNTNIQFINNTATSIGGAIYLKPTGTSIGSPCVLWFEDVDTFCGYYTFSCANPAELHVQISFEDNNAQLGKAVYGDFFGNCSWLAALQQSNSELKMKSPYEVLEILSNNASNNFHFNLPYKSGDRIVNTNAVEFQLLSEEGNSSDNPITLFPGQVTNINITALDSLFQSIPLSITSRTDDSNSLSQLGQSGFWFLAGDNNTLTPITLNGDGNSSSVVTIYSVTSTATTDIYLELRNCSYGFIFQDRSCVCDPNLLSQTSLNTFQCNMSSGHITVPRFFWLGSTPAGEYTLQECIFNYCNDQDSVTFSGIDNIDTQCANNRAGILCGNCSEGFSTVIGSTRCKECDNDPVRIIGIIIAFLIAGIALVCIIAFLNFTVTEGYINGVIFYGNLIVFYAPTFSQILDPGTTSPLIFISWINFNPGFELCIFKGMDTITQVSLSFLFPAYLFLLMSIIIWLAKRSKRLTKYGVSAIRAFATLLLLCYSSVSTTCVKLMSWIIIHGSNGNSYTRWRFDPNVQYGRDVHGFLVFISVFLLLVYIIPFALILATPPKLMSKTKCGRKIALKYKPVFDAFHNPLKENFSYWVGFRCIIRTIPLIISSLSTYPTNVFATTVFIVCFLFIHENLQPFKKTLQNRMETYFLINLVLFGIGTLYYPQSETYFDDSISAAYIILIVVFAYSGIFFIGCIHVHLHYPTLISKIKEKLTQFCCCCRPKKETVKVEEVNTDTNDESFKFAVDESFAPKVVTYTELREPLLDSGHVVLSKV